MPVQFNVLGNIAEYHHEAVNGTGYPNGRKRDEIPLRALLNTMDEVVKYGSSLVKVYLAKIWTRHTEPDL